MKLDPYKHEERYFNWKIKVNNSIPNLSESNSNLILHYLNDMEKGINVASASVKGSRSFGRLNSLKDQIVPAYEAFWKFIEQEKQKYSTPEGKRSLKGKFGGDSDIAKEVLSFGFMVESDDQKAFSGSGAELGLNINKKSMP